ncbi:hypothetical protein PoB_002733300 [Plakobranchus ocellatus]|uniref:Uncharacterized protein n=1 Tax=Plakobranchus ocellatus TaxID=259542 RepID=A0AAV4A2B0_9GAST|nr:hypothetical protein PoB_002733300 [Plakobranchus ocellatus]
MEQQFAHSSRPDPRPGQDGAMPADRSRVRNETLRYPTDFTPDRHSSSRRQTAITGKMDGKRSRGRQRITFIENLKSRAIGKGSNNNFIRLIENRLEWNKHDRQSLLQAGHPKKKKIYVTRSLNLPHPTRPQQTTTCEKAVGRNHQTKLRYVRNCLGRVTLPCLTIVTKERKKGAGWNRQQILMINFFTVNYSLFGFLSAVKISVDSQVLTSKPKHCSKFST